MPTPRKAPERDSGLTREDQERLDTHTRLALATWPQIDPVVETIVTRIGKAYRHLDAEMRTGLDEVGMTKEEFKVVMELHGGPRTHGALCRELEVSTGVMTNRLDKLERIGLVSRARDPTDRRGVMLSLTATGAERLDAYINRGAHRERQLLEALSPNEKQQLNRLLLKLVDSLEAERGR